MKCSKCEKNFLYNLIGTVYPGGKEKEEIICPYCNHICGNIMTSQTVETIKNDEKLQTSKNSKELLTERQKC